MLVSSISFGGPDAAQFGLDATSACTKAPLPAGDSCQFSAIFEPSTPGRWEANIDVVSNAVTSPHVAELSGTAVAPVPPTTGPVGPVGPAPRIAIDNSFKIGKPILNRKKGTAKLPVTLPGPGTLSIAGAGASTQAVGAAGIVKVPIAARGSKKRLLERSGRVKLKITVTFVPSGGTANSQTATLKLKKT